MAIGIPGVDEKIFIDLLGGDEELYVAIIDSFIKETPTALKKLASVSKETLSDYAIYVHGFKVACATICAEEARKMALSLEQKARAGDFDGVMAENGPFLKYAEDLFNKIKDWYEKQK